MSILYIPLVLKFQNNFITLSENLLFFLELYNVCLMFSTTNSDAVPPPPSTILTFILTISPHEAAKFPGTAESGESQLSLSKCSHMTTRI